VGHHPSQTPGRKRGSVKEYEEEKYLTMETSRWGVSLVAVSKRTLHNTKNK